MSIGIILTSVIVPVLPYGFVRRELLQPCFVSFVLPTFIIIDENGGSNMHGVHESVTFTTLKFYQNWFNSFREQDPTPPNDMKV